MGNLMVESKEFKKFGDEFDYSIGFLENFADLINYSGRIISFISDKKFHIINTVLLNNSVQTLQSIKLCCSIGSFADANTLIRRLRDDLLLYVYILDVTNKRKPFTEETLNAVSLEDAGKFADTFSKLSFNPNFTDDEKAVAAWLENSVVELPRNLKMKLGFENYMKHLKQNKNIAKSIKDYNLQNYWQTLSYKLNNYVHNNGQQFTMHNLIRYNNNDLEIYFKNINTRTTYIITLFLVFILMTEAALIGTSDMIDYLDCGMEPPDGCQYEIASFIQEFIDTKVVKLHPELKQYLIDNNNYGMKIK